MNPTPPLVPGLDAGRDAGRLNATLPSLVTGLDAGRLNPKLSLVAGLDGERLDPLPSLLGDRSLVAGLDAARLISPSSHPVRTLTRVNSVILERGGSSRSAVLPPLMFCSEASALSLFSLTDLPIHAPISSESVLPCWPIPVCPTVPCIVCQC